MTTNFIINGQIIFSAETNRLFPVEQPEAFIVLPNSASRCLSVLINHHGDVVTMAEFHKQAWGRNNVIVSDQSIYQNISLLRKSLTEAGAAKGIIETQTRRGWMIPEKITVEKVDETKSSLMKAKETQESDHTVKNKEMLPDTTDSYKENPVQSINRYYRGNIAMYITFVIFSTSVISLLYALWVNYPVVYTWPSHQYQRLGSVSDCHVFRNRSRTNNKFYVDVIQRNQIKCNEYPWLYITNYFPAGQISIITCKAPLLQKSGNSPDCLSYFLLGLKHGRNGI
ncbi:TPA: winged helix-turn-helix domain-containing protein [Salmonella enterica]